VAVSVLKSTILEKQGRRRVAEAFPIDKRVGLLINTGIDIKIGGLNGLKAPLALIG
jgi:hypothetical protein